MLTASEVRDAFKYLFPNELPALQQLVRSLPAHPLVINIGAGAGTSGLAILESRPDVALITIDIQNESSPFGCLEAERDVIARAGLGGRWGKHWRQIKGDSVEIGLNWSDALNKLVDDSFGQGMEGFLKQPDMVFVDGGHSYEQARDDIQIWLRLLRDGGIIAVHDYQKGMLDPDPNGPHPKPWPGVDMAVDENLKGKYRQLLYVDSLIAFVKERI